MKCVNTKEEETAASGTHVNTTTIPLSEARGTHVNTTTIPLSEARGTHVNTTTIPLSEARGTHVNTTTTIHYLYHYSQVSRRALRVPMVFSMHGSQWPLGRTPAKFMCGEWHYVPPPLIVYETSLIGTMSTENYSEAGLESSDSNTNVRENDSDYPMRNSDGLSMHHQKNSMVVAFTWSPPPPTHTGTIREGKSY
jgi:hypothetical protein